MKFFILSVFAISHVYGECTCVSSTTIAAHCTDGWEKEKGVFDGECYEPCKSGYYSQDGTMGTCWESCSNKGSGWKDIGAACVTGSWYDFRWEWKDSYIRDTKHFSCTDDRETLGMYNDWSREVRKCFPRCNYGSERYYGRALYKNDDDCESECRGKNSGWDNTKQWAPGCKATGEWIHKAVCGDSATTGHGWSGSADRVSNKSKDQCKTYCENKNTNGCCEWRTNKWCMWKTTATMRYSDPHGDTHSFGLGWTNRRRLEAESYSFTIEKPSMPDASSMKTDSLLHKDLVAELN